MRARHWRAAKCPRQTDLGLRIPTKTNLEHRMPDENRPRGRNARRKQTSWSECPTKDLVVGMPDENRPRRRNARRKQTWWSESRPKQTSWSECPTKTDLLARMPEGNRPRYLVRTRYHWLHAAALTRPERYIAYALGKSQCPLGDVNQCVSVRLP